MLVGFGGVGVSMKQVSTGQAGVREFGWKVALGHRDYYGNRRLGRFEV